MNNQNIPLLTAGLMSDSFKTLLNTGPRSGAGSTLELETHLCED